MTDENLMNTEQPQSMSVNSGMDSVSGDLGVQSPSATQKEEYVPKSRVNEIVQAERRRAYEKALQEAAQRAQPQQQQSTDNRSTQIDESKLDTLVAQKLEAIEKKRAEDALRIQQQQDQQRLYYELNNKFETERKADPKFDEKLASVNYFNDLRGVQYLLNQFDNAGAMAKHLADNMADAVTIEQLAQLRDQSGTFTANHALAKLRQISDRLKQNEAAKSAPVPPNPIGQVETTIRDGIGNTGLTDLQSLKRMAIAKS